MSEHDPFLHNGHIPAPADEVTDTLPPDLEAIHARLIHESHGWALRLPEAESLASYTRQVTGQAATLTQHAPERSDIAASTEPLFDLDTAPQMRVTQRIQHLSRGRMLLGVAAAVVIVALMAAVFSSLAPGHGPATGKPTVAIQSTSTPQPTATPRPPFGPITGSWLAVPGLTNVSGSVTIAPSNPNVVYEVQNTETSNGEPVGQYAVLRRSDDDGKTWRTLTLPAPTDSSVAAWGPSAIIVGPADPNTLVVSVDTRMSYNVPQACPASLTMAYRPPTAGSTSAANTLAATLPSDGYQRCSIQYVSSDGGASWSKVQFTGVRGGANGLLTLRAQGSRLYGTVYVNDQQGLYSGYHIIMSTDGIHWQPVDASLLSQVKHICGFVVVSTDTTLFANTNSGDCSAGIGTPTSDELWRSDDDGATWRDLGPIGGYSIISPLAAAEQGPNDAQPTLYVYTLRRGAPYYLHLTVSTDGGYTWQTAPTAGLPAGYTPAMPVPGMLSDGSLVVILTSNFLAGPSTPVTRAFYAWHVGDSKWHQVAPNLPFANDMTLDDGEDQFLVTPSGGVHGTLWHTHVTIALRTSPLSVTRYSS